MAALPQKLRIVQPLPNRSLFDSTVDTLNTSITAPSLLDINQTKLVISELCESFSAISPARRLKQPTQNQQKSKSTAKPNERKKKNIGDNTSEKNANVDVEQKDETDEIQILDDYILLFKTQQVFNNPLVEWLINNTTVGSKEEAVHLLEQWIREGDIEKQKKLRIEIQKHVEYFHPFFQALEKIEASLNPPIVIAARVQRKTTDSNKKESSQPNKPINNTKYAAKKVDVMKGEDSIHEADDSTLDSMRHSYLKEGVFEGNLVHKMRHGNGKMTYYSGEIYEGDWKDDKWHGVGTFKWPNGDVYFGNFANSKRNGQGTLILTSGAKYEGEFVDDNFCGLGMYIWPNGELRYQGFWKNNKFHGFGVLLKDNGQYYQGHWEDGKINGIGELFGPIDKEMSQKIESKFQQQQTSNQQKDNSETGQDQIRIEQQQEGKEISPSNTPTQYEINTQENVENPIKETKQEEDQHHSTLETSTKLNIQDPAQDRNEPAAQLIQRGRWENNKLVEQMTEEEMSNFQFAFFSIFSSSI